MGQSWHGYEEHCALKPELTLGSQSIESKVECVAWAISGQLTAETKVSMFSIGFEQDPESYKTRFKIFRLWCKITQHMKKQENSAHVRKDVQCQDNIDVQII